MKKRTLAVLLLLAVLIAFNVTNAYADPYTDLESGWNDRHDQYYYEDGSLAKGLCFIPDEETGEEVPYYFDKTDGLLQIGWISDSFKYYDEETGRSVTETIWYYADGEGILQTGWLTLNSKNYYLDPVFYTLLLGGVYEIDSDSYCFNDAGVMQTGWTRSEISEPDPKYGPKAKRAEWRYAGDDGVLKCGWQKIDGKWYFLDPDTYLMYTDLCEIGGSHYFFGAGGEMKSGWIKHALGGSHYDWYYSGPGGALKWGWQKIGSNWYYFDYVMYTGYSEIGGKPYYFNASGAWVSKPSGWVKDGYGRWYYYSNGKALTGWQQISGKWYYFDPDARYMRSGIVNDGSKAYFLGAGGVWIKKPSGWQKTDDGCWYYFEKNKAVTGWKKINNKWYYFDGDGIMVTGWLELDGKWYYFSSGGVMKTGTVSIGGYTYYLRASGAWDGK